MLRKLILKIIVGCFLLAMIAAPSIHSARADSLGFALTQKSARFGDEYLYVSPHGWQMLNPHSGFAIASREPDWKIVYYNKRTQTYYETTIEQWSRDMVIEAGADDWGTSHWVKTGVETVCGIKCSVYTIKGRMRHFHATTKWVPTDFVAAKYVIAEGYPINPKLANMMKVVFNVPTFAGIPFRLSYLSATGAEQTVVNTYRVDRCPLPAVAFDRPAGYKQVMDRAEVMLGREQRDMLLKLSTGSDKASIDQIYKELNQHSYGQGLGNKEGAGQSTRINGEEIKRMLEMYRQQQGTKPSP